MNTIKLDHHNTKMIAHRGLSGLEPENSIPAFIAAGNRSFYGIETDVHVTKDGKFVIIHDCETGRVAAENIHIENSTYEEVRKIRLNNLCYEEMEKGVKIGSLTGRLDLIIPSLEEYICVCKKYDKKCVLELKGQYRNEDIARMVEEIRKLDYLEHVIFISFSLENLIKLRNILPHQKLQYLTIQYNGAILNALKTYRLDLDVDYPTLTEEIIRELHDENIEVNCWTVNSKEDAEKFASWGVDYITSNILE